jgi:outer membrane protein assembly factor BamB
MADASPLVDAHTDKLIYPSENGVIYIIRLNSVFNPITGTMTIDPDEAYRWRFRGTRSGVNRRFWLGFESSPAAWRGHVFLADNGGHLVCLNLNTLEIVWMVDNIDNSDSTPVIAIEDGHPYIYISMSFNGNGIQVPEGSSTLVPIRKIDAVTGRIVWETEHRCYVNNIAGGVQATIALGQHQLRDLIFVSIARSPTSSSGLLVALDKSTGETVWEYRTGSHGWSSPVAVYDEDGRGYIIHTELVRTMHLLEGLTGNVLDRIDLGGHVEASPAVFESTIVIGTRWQDILGIRLR